MANWYTTRDAVLEAIGQTGVSIHPVIDRIIAAESRQIERWTRRFYIPRTETHLFRWPEPRAGRTGDILWVDQDLLAVTTLQSETQDSSPTTIPSSDYFLEPNSPQVGGETRYDRIELDQSSSASFNPGATAQRSISVLGSWGYTDLTKSVGLVDDPSGITSSETTLIVDDGGPNGVLVGHTLLIGSEQLFVSEKILAALSPGGVGIKVNDSGDITTVASAATKTFTVDASHTIQVGELLRLNNEEMLVVAVNGNDISVDRGQNGSIMATHANDTDVHVNRTLTVERGVNGTTAASISDDDSISAYVVPEDIQDWCLEETINAYHMGRSGGVRTIGSVDATREVKGIGITDLREGMVEKYQRLRMAAV